MSLLSVLKARLAKDKILPFAELMRLALYDPSWGYYSGPLPKLGQAGDFITAPELSPLFGKAIANQCQEVMKGLVQPCLLEYGAGTGQLCVDILRHLEILDSLPETYYILELSADLIERQQNHIQQALPQLASRVQWLSALPNQPFNGIILANEVLDAMPVHRFQQTAQGLLESHVTLDAQENLVETWLPCQNPRLSHYVTNRLSFLEAPYLSEVNLYLDAWIAANYALLDQGLVLLMDYGFPRHEYYHPDRNQGTLMCHYHHRAHTDWLAHLGEQDITAHVDFTQVAEAASAAGFQVAGFTSQAAFLLSNGLLDLLAEIKEPKASLSANTAVKQLIQPSEMGELFKVIALTKNLSLDLKGFQLQDRRRSL